MPLDTVNVEDEDTGETTKYSQITVKAGITGVAAIGLWHFFIVIRLSSDLHNINYYSSISYKFEIKNPCLYDDQAPTYFNELYTAY